MVSVSILGKYVNKARLMPKAFAQAPVGTVKKRLITPVRKKAYRFRQRAQTNQLASIDKKSGYEVGNTFFWSSRRFGHDWSGVNQRILKLAEMSPESLRQFVQLAFEACQDPLVLVNLSRSAMTREHMRECLLSESLEPGAPIFGRMRRSQMTCAGFIASATILLETEDSERFVKIAQESSPAFTKPFFQFLDSVGGKLAALEDEGLCASLLHSGFRHSKKKRLILTDTTKKRAALSLLFQGAQDVTLIAMDDLYGRADFSDLSAHSGGCHVSVEHPRSRITRFSSEYHRIHEETQKVAEDLIDGLKERDPTGTILTDLAVAKLALADHIFFPCLQLKALQTLIASDEFDHIVIAIDGDSPRATVVADRFINMLLGIPQLLTDPRVEMLSTANNEKGRAYFGKALSLVLSGKLAPTAIPSKARGVFFVALEMQHHYRKFAARNGFSNADPRPKVLMATTQVAAYNSSSAAFCDTLGEDFNIQVAFSGGNLLSFSELTTKDLDASRVVTMPQNLHKSYTLLVDWVNAFLSQSMDGLHPHYIRHVIAARPKDVALNGIVSPLAHTHLCDAWFNNLKDMDQLPQVVVLTPFRTARVAAFADVARRYGVPSIALEPHGLNASYCRYSKVNADYYGVISEFFAQEAVKGFGMNLERCPVVGSPRLLAPTPYDRVEATQKARAALTDAEGVDFDEHQKVVTYFSQPSNWEQVAEVWTSILEATADLDCLLILKTHPEETSSRVTAYLDIAATMGASDRVITVGCNATDAIEVSDLVLSGYSATVLEAALLRKPVFCVTNGELDYPLNQNEVIGGPIMRSSEELREHIAAFIINPDPFYAVSDTFLEEETQFIDGYGPHLTALVDRVIFSPKEKSLRAKEDLPSSLFLDGPHKVYKV